jgi:hypothetical protein
MECLTDKASCVCNDEESIDYVQEVEQTVNIYMVLKVNKYVTLETWLGSYLYKPLFIQDSRTAVIYDQ